MKNRLGVEAGLELRRKISSPRLIHSASSLHKGSLVGGRDHATHQSEHLSPAAAALVRLVLPEPVCQKRDVWLLRFSLSIPCPLSTDWTALAFEDVAVDKHSILTDPCLCFAGDSGFADSNSLEITGEGCAGVILGWWGGGQLLCSAAFSSVCSRVHTFSDRAVYCLLRRWYIDHACNHVLWGSHGYPGAHHGL